MEFNMKTEEVRKLIGSVIEKINAERKQELAEKNDQYLNSFKVNNREEEYQAYTNAQVSEKRL